MAHRYTNTKEQSFSTKISDKVLTPQTAPFAHALEIHRIEVLNSSGSDAQVGWGYAYDSGAIKIGDYDTVGPSPKLTDRSADIQAGATAIGNGGGIMIQAPEAFNSVQFNITVAGGAISAIRYWNGSSFATFSGTQLETMDTTVTGQEVLLVTGIGDMVALQPGDSPVTDDGLSAGSYALLIELASPVTVDAADVIKMLNRVEVVANGNILVDSYDGGKKLPARASVVPYVSTADADNSVTIEYSQST